ncbi:MAG: hypothetical protein OEU95_01095, partial [Nitrospirota bacterium]|nr:hypothetical protein [Nitrospirota bacterium]
VTLRTPVFTAGGKYNRSETETTGTDLIAVTNVNERYGAVLGWKPEGLPSMDLRVERANLFDERRLNQDTVNDTVSMTLNYVPEYGHLKGFEMRYQPSYNRIENKMDEVVVTDSSHNGRLTFSDAFFNRRVSLFTSYNIAHTETEIVTSSRTAEISYQLFPFSGLSKIDDTPSNVKLDLNSNLINGELSDDAGINIGVVGNTEKRNIGLDFVAATEVNTIFIWVDKELPAQVANVFDWDIYTSSDNQNWTLLQEVPVVSFGPFQNRFRITFSNVTARYIKVVTTPLVQGDVIDVKGDFLKINVTEIQAFLTKSAGEFERREKTGRTNHIYNMDVRTRILDAPSLYYEFSYYLTKAEGSFTNTTLSNGLYVSHSFSSKVSASARAAREDIDLQDEAGTTYLYNASVTARPLTTLSHTLNYSGQTQDVAGERTDTNAVFLANILELYKGLSLNINGGISTQSKDTGGKTVSEIFSIGSGIVPHRRVSIDLYYSRASTEQSGSESGDSTDLTRRSTAGVSYRPFDTVYLFTSLERITTNERTRDLQNYAANWSPFPDGSLQFTVSYNESLTTDEGKSRVINPNVRWNINRRTFLDVSGQFIKSESSAHEAESVISGATLRTVF